MNYKAISIVVLGLVLLSALAWGLTAFQKSRTLTPETLAKQQVLPIVNAFVSNDKEAALKAYNQIVNSATTTPQTKASAVLSGSFAQFEVSGNITDAIKSVREIQAVANNTSFRPFIRASAITELAVVYRLSGNNNDVYKAIFDTAPFSQMATTSVDFSSRNSSIRSLLEYSYGISPTYSTAVDVAATYMWGMYNREQAHPDYAPNQKAIDGATLYLARAADLLNSASLEQPSNVADYQNYRIFRANVIATLAHFKGDPYTSQYKKEYEDAIAYFKQSNNNLRVEIVDIYYALALLQIDNDAKGARIYADEAAALANSAPASEKAQLVARLHKWLQPESVTPRPQEFEKLGEISASFKTLLVEAK